MPAAGRHVLNACADRYRFAVGLAACLIVAPRQPAALDAHAEVIRQLAHFAPDAICLTDESDCGIDLPRVTSIR